MRKFQIAGLRDFQPGHVSGGQGRRFWLISLLIDPWSMTCL
jgi:hypothetical protein